MRGFAGTARLVASLQDTIEERFARRAQHADPAWSSVFRHRSAG
jgi:hypothetical protein